MSPGDHSKQRSLCQWPECEMFANREIRRGERMKMVMVCPRHRIEFEGLPLGGPERMPWQPRRKALIGTHSPKRRRAHDESRA